MFIAGRTEELETTHTTIPRVIPPAIGTVVLVTQNAVDGARLAAVAAAFQRYRIAIAVFSSTTNRNGLSTNCV